MPYIKQNDRVALECPDERPDSSGELNYILTREVEKYRLFHGHCYQTFNDIIGALEGAKLELYRRMVAPYEDKKIIENGDVYKGPTRKAKTASSPKKLSEEEVQRAKALRDSGQFYNQIAETFNVSTMTIWRALNG